jgi:hypothetical protein
MLLESLHPRSPTTGKRPAFLGFSRCSASRGWPHFAGSITLERIICFHPRVAHVCPLLANVGPRGEQIIALVRWKLWSWMAHFSRKRREMGHPGIQIFIYRVGNVGHPSCAASRPNPLAPAERSGAKRSPPRRLQGIRIPPPSPKPEASPTRAQARADATERKRG